MKHQIPLTCLLLSALLFLGGCGADKSTAVKPIGASSAQSSSATDSQEREVGTGVVVPGQDSADSLGNVLDFTDTGKTRITYTDNQSSVQYITSVNQMPNIQGLPQYNDTFFEENALVVVIETVTSGSIDVDLQEIRCDDSTATVILSHEQDAEADGTDDMATWALWAVVKSDLDCQWSVANPALGDDLEIS
jgi:hypothetical protein